MHADFSQLTADSLLHVTGGRVPDFLQGQLSCDCLQVNPALSVSGALCSAQGRVISDCRILQLGDGHFALRLRRDVRDITHETLKKYAMFSRTELSDRDDAWGLIAVWGKDAAAVLENAVGGAPTGRDVCLQTGDSVTCQVDDDGEAFEIAVASAALPNLLERLSAHARQQPESHWQQNELRRGLVRTTADISGHHVPQVLNYDYAGLLNFRKGCYIGQEVVARLHYKGKSKRRCAVYAVAGDATASAGDSVVSQDGERQVGSVVRVVTAPGEAALAVALVTVEDSEQPLALADRVGDGVLLQPMALPYSVRGSSAAS